MNEHIIDFIETSVAVLIFIAALTNGLIIVSEHADWIRTAVSANKLKDRIVTEVWAETKRMKEQANVTGTDIIGMLAIEDERPYELLIDGKRFEMPVAYLSEYDLSFIETERTYRMTIERDIKGFIKRITYE